MGVSVGRCARMVAIASSGQAQAMSNARTVASTLVGCVFRM